MSTVMLIEVEPKITPHWPAAGFLSLGVRTLGPDGINLGVRRSLLALPGRGVVRHREYVPQRRFAQCPRKLSGAISRIPQFHDATPPSRRRARKLTKLI